MPRNKRGGKAPRGIRGGRGGRGGRHAAPNHHHFEHEIAHALGLTLAEEARQTSQRDHTFWSSNTLRSKPVSFISAGTSEPLKLLEDLIVQSNQVNHSPDGTTADSSLEKAAQLLPQQVASLSESHQNEAEQEATGKYAAKSGGPTHTNTPAQPLFFIDVSRETSSQLPTKTTVIPMQPSPSSTCSSDEEVILFKGRNPRAKESKCDDFSLSQIHAEIQMVEEQILDSEPVLPVNNNRQRNRGPKRGKKEPRQNKSEEDALIADYIANMRENGETDDFILQATYSGRDLGGENTNFVIDVGTSGQGDDFDGGEDHEHDETTSSENRNGKHLVKTKQDEGLPSDTDESGSELDDETLEQLLEGHETRAGPAPASATNFHELDTSDTDSSDDAPAPKDFPNTEEFDFMDWERPSLRRKRKGARPHIDFGADDSELEANMWLAYNNNRQRKSEKKRQREEQRAQGLLGQTKPGDLRIKYPQGISLDEVGEEMKSFLQSGHQTLTFPPMDKHARKILHDIALKFNIKSKSTGNADQRRTTLYRTLRTLAYNESTIDHALSKWQRRYFARQDMKGKAARGQKTLRSRTNDAAATYRDGEVVGAAAPELGEGNRGRAMLEKMGWSSGTALGAMDNKGILQPVTHTMKRSKAGLA